MRFYGLMPFGLGGLSGLGGIRYLLRDEFTTDLAAGSVNGTLAEPGPGTRTAIENDGQLSISAGKLNIPAQGTPVFGDLGLVYSSIARISSRLVKYNFNMSSVSGGGLTGMGSVNTLAIAAAQQSLDSSTTPGFLTQVYTAPGNILVAPTLTVGIDYQVCFILRSTGVYIFIKGGVYLTWILLYQVSVGNFATVWPMISNHSNVWLVDYVRIPDKLVLPTPLAFDQFTRADGALGNSEGSGPDSQSTPLRSWTGATWAIASNVAVNAPTLGSELVVNPGFEGAYDDESGGGGGTVNVAPDWSKRFVETDGTDTLDKETTTIHGGLASQKIDVDADNEGVETDLISVVDDTWYYLSMWMYVTTGVASMRSIGAFMVFSVQDTIGTGSWEQVLAVARATSTGAWEFGALSSGGAADFFVDDASVKPLTLSTLFASVETNTADVLVDVDIDTDPDGTQAGVVTNLDDAATPANFLIAYHNGVNVKLEKCVAGVYSTLIDTAAAFSAGATLRVIKDDDEVRVFYNNAVVGTVQTVSDVGIKDNTLHGMFSTDSGNQLDNFQVFPRGTDGEFSQLDRY